MMGLSQKAFVVLNFGLNGTTLTALVAHGYMADRVVLENFVKHGLELCGIIQLYHFTTGLEFNYTKLIVDRRGVR
jgi:hypothetical protein